MDWRSALDLKAFVPAKDFETSKRFYRDLGFEELWSNQEIAEIQAGAFRFLLQKFYVEAHAGNFMMQLTVPDLDAVWVHVTEIRLAEKYPGIMLKAPAVQPWGLRILYLSDPSGVLWHLAQRR